MSLLLQTESPVHYGLLLDQLQVHLILLVLRQIHVNHRLLSLPHTRLHTGRWALNTYWDFTWRSKNMMNYDILCFRLDVLVDDVNNL